MFMNLTKFENHRLFDTNTCERIAAFYIGDNTWALKVLKDKAITEVSPPIFGGSMNTLDQFFIVKCGQRVSCEELFMYAKTTVVG